ERVWIRLALERYERAAYEGSRRVLINYESVKRLLQEKWGYGIPLRRMTYAPETAFRPDLSGGDDTPALLEELRPREAPLLVAASRQDPRKGVDVLLRALAQLRDDGVVYRACLLGGGPLLEAHRRLSARLGLEAAVALPGFVSDSYAFLRRADVFVLPSL